MPDRANHHHARRTIEAASGWVDCSTSPTGASRDCGDPLLADDDHDAAMDTEPVRFLVLWMAGWTHSRQLESTDFLREENGAENGPGP